MKNSWNFHGSWFLTFEFPPARDVTQFCRICVAESLFFERIVKNIKIPGFFFRKEYTGVKIGKNLFTGHEYTSLLKSVSL